MGSGPGRRGRAKAGHLFGHEQRKYRPNPAASEKLSKALGRWYIQLTQVVHCLTVVNVSVTPLLVQGGRPQVIEPLLELLQRHPLSRISLLSRQPGCNPLT